MRYVVLLTMLFFPAFPFFVREPIGKEVIISKLKTIRTIVQEVTSEDEDVISKRNDLRLLINDVIIRVDQFEGKFPYPYLASLDRLRLASLRIADTTTGGKIDILQRMTWDLSIKFKDRSNALGARLFNDLLPVSVTCQRKGNVVNRLRVRYASLGYAVDSTRPDGSFQVLTSPAKEEMVPGYYRIWVTEDGSYTMLRSWAGEISPEKKNDIQFDLP